ncbi:MAG: restriction endonuclease subunit S [candidate division WOR-3 bacterium]
MQVKLSQILTSLESGGRPKGGASLENKGIPSLGAEHLDGNGGFNFKTVKYIPEEFFNSLKNGIIGKENILIVKDGATTGKVSFVTDEFPFDKAAVNEHVFLLKVDKSKANPKFVFHYLKCPQGQREIMRDFRGATVGGISRGFVDYVKFELPPLPDQLHIANLLSKAENLIAQRKESIRLLDEFLKSTFLEMFGKLKGEKIPLSTVCIVNPKKSEISSLDKGLEVSFIPMAYVTEKGEINLTQSRKLEEVWNGFTYFRENDVVFAKITPCMENGKGAIMKNLKNKIGFGTTEFHVLRPLEGLSTSEWLYHLTMQHSFRKKAEQNMTGSAGQKRVPSDFFEKFKVILPPIELQTQFTQFVEKTETLKTQYQQSLQELENLYGSLSQKAFRGELLKK